MIHFLKGKLAIKGEGYIVVDVLGVGYRVFVPSNSSVYLKKENEDITIYTAMIVREDDMSLYGFSDEAGLDLFNKLITVNSVGAKAALAILSAMPPQDVKKAIVFEDAQMLTRANGIGKKTAQKIVLDLKDKLGDISISKDDDGHAIVENISVSNDDKEIAIDALINLGYSRSEAAMALQGVNNEELSAEEYIKMALKNL